jgi:hypothetical protein
MAADTVVVACKMPNGLILRLMHKTTVQEPQPGGGFRDQVVMRATGEEVTLAGYGAEAGKSPKAIVTDEGYALTFDVPKPFWDMWLEQNQELEVVRNRLVFAHSSVNSARAESRDHAKTRNGLEPLALKNDPRSPRSPRRELSELEQATAS